MSTIPKMDCEIINEEDLNYPDSQPVGLGGSCLVWRCMCRGRNVAAKTLSPYPYLVLNPDYQLTPCTTERTREAAVRELLIWSRLKHPNVVPLQGYVPRGVPLIVSAWQEHGNLRGYLTRFPATEPWDLADVARGLAFLHEAGVIHGDVKQENVLVGADHVSRLSDFGCSTLAEDRNALDPHPKAEAPGTTPYLDPSLLDGARRSKATDFWAFGCLAYEVASKQPMYWHVKNLNSSNIVVAVVGRCLPTRFTDSPQVPDDIWECLDACWSETRPEDAEIAILLDAFSKRGRSFVIEPSPTTP